MNRPYFGLDLVRAKAALNVLDGLASRGEREEFLASKLREHAELAVELRFKERAEEQKKGKRR